MIKDLWRSLLVSPAIFGVVLAVSAAVTAASATEVSQSRFAKTPRLLVADRPATLASDANTLDLVVHESEEDKTSQDDPMAQVTSVSQLRDVQPTDWAFQALQSLVERYGCIAGYPNGTFRGNRAMTRYEFAAGLNACLDRVNELISSGTSDLVRKEDIITLRRLQQEYATELTALRGRVDNLEAQTAQLEANQFSTTTKLVGEVIFALVNDFGNYPNDNAVFEDRVRLDFQTSFTGQDTLHTRLAAGNVQRLNFHNSITPGANGQFTTYDGEGSTILSFSPSTDNSVAVDWLSYYFPVFGHSQIYIAATGGVVNDIVPAGNPYFNDGGDGGNGALSVFAQVNPIYRIGGGTGIGTNIVLGKSGTTLGDTSLSLAYFADNAPIPQGGAGLFNGDYAALGQFNFNLNDRFSIAATYSHSYHSTGTGIFNAGAPGSSRTPFSGIVGTAQANDPSILLAGGQRPVVTNSYGGEVAFRLNKQISLSGFVDKTSARIIGRGDGDIWTYAVGVAFPDLGKEGSVLGLVAGVEPTLRGLRAVGAPANFARSNVYHFEGFYRYQLSDNISVTPGVIVLTNPGQNGRNNDVIIGTLRTTFTF
ncbi:MAG: iron uptake porin [Chroococcidiopsidaceae cyanobacterium CP_BM_ER_R8_30]|nr:iron uptake porin [Chroococcidiopsidaceae cyanobacterium CP_BM_ER_R8_30]